MNLINKTKDIINIYSNIELPFDEVELYTQLCKITASILKLDVVDDSVIFIAICLLYKEKNVEKNVYLKIVEEVRLRGLFTKLSAINRLFILVNNICKTNGIICNYTDMINNIGELSYKDIDSIKIDEIDHKVTNCNNNIIKFINKVYPNVDTSALNKKFKIKKFNDLINEEI